MIPLGVGFDCETRAIMPGVQAPPSVTLQWGTIQNDQISQPQLTGGRDSYRWMLDQYVAWLRTPGLVMYGGNVAYDHLCMVSRAGAEYGYGAAESLLCEVFDKYRRNEVADILTDQKILDLAAGCYRGYFNQKGKWVRYGYNLADVTRRHTGRELAKDDDGWRLRFGELEDVPLTAFPGEATTYCLDDGLATTQVPIEQQRFPHAIAQNFPGRDPLVDRFNQARGAFWLKLISVWGIKTNPSAVAVFGKQVQEAYHQLANELADDPIRMRDGSTSTLVYREYKLDRQAIVRRVESLGKLALVTVQKDGPAKITLAHDNLMATGDQLLALCAIWRTIKDGCEQRSQQHLRAFDTLRQNGLAFVEFHKSTKTAADRMIQVCIAQNRTVQLTETSEVALGKEVCDATDDPLLQSYAELSSLSKTVSNDLKFLQNGTYYPIHTRYEEYLDTNRTSSSNPNIQNIRRLPGIRECFIPRAGCVLIDADYKMLELYALAQICLWKFGHSALAQTLLAGQDAHLKVAAQMKSIDYLTAKGLYTAGDSDISNTRDCGKVANFGIPGGLGPDSLVTYAAKAYGVKITREQAVQIKADFLAAFPEMKDYFRYVTSLESFPDSGSFNVVDPYSGRLRADATYCAACNDGFQGLGANVAKLAGWFIAEACYVNRSDALFGCRPVNFIHDQWLVEACEAIAAEAAKSLAHHMDRAAKIVLPDCPTYASVLLTRVWSKKAKRIEVDGIPVPWEPSKELAA